jgi:uncharacterized protein YecT (DUF1311 family)
MKKCCAFLILLTAQVVLGQGKDGCYDSAKTQADLNHCADNEYASADKKLNEVYQQVLKQYATDSAFIAKLKVAQRAWLAFRDAELQALYPAENKPAEYGSAWPMCRGQQLATAYRGASPGIAAMVEGRQGRRRLRRVGEGPA